MRAHPATDLTFDNVCKTFPGASSPVLDRLSLEVPAGEICVLVGPSGCGKTTAMRMVNRMIEATSGDIRIGGNSVFDSDPIRLRREIGYVIQQIGLFPHETISQNIATVPRLLGWEQERIDARVRELIELVGLDPAEVAERYPAQLSGGQRQRIGVARALAADPPLMLMDEPFGAIDPINRNRLQNEFLRLQDEIGKTILFVTHDIDEAIKMGDRIAVMEADGRLAQYATPAELLIQPANNFVERFVGADRALKRLSLLRVRDLSLWSAPTLRVGEPTGHVHETPDAHDVPYPLLLDADGRPLRWIDLARDPLPAADEVPTPTVEPLIDQDSVLRDALSRMLAAGVEYAPVVNRRGEFSGVLSITTISLLLSQHDRQNTTDPAAVGGP